MKTMKIQQIPCNTCKNKDTRKCVHDQGYVCTKLQTYQIKKLYEVKN